MKQTAILGFGNPVRSDDGIGCMVIDELKKVGCDTARSVLALTDEELVRRTDLEEETIADVKQVLSREFEENKEG